MTEKEIILMSPPLTSTCSPQFPSFTSLILNTNSSKEATNDVYFTDDSESDDDELYEGMKELSKGVKKLKSSHFIQQENKIMLLELECKVIPSDSSDIVKKSINLVENNLPPKKIATLNIESCIKIPTYKIQTWKAELIFSRIEWDYFNLICDYNVLDILESKNLINYQDHFIIVHVNSCIFNTVYEFLNKIFNNGHAF